MQIAEWNSHVFCVDTDLIRSFTDLTIKTSAATENKTSGKSAWVAYKNAGVATVSLKVLLSAFTGADVFTEAQAFLTDARNGASAYFYVGSNKILPCKLMLTSCDVGNVMLTTACQWTQAELTLTLQQCEKIGSSGSSSKSTSKKTPETEEEVKEEVQETVNEVQAVKQVKATASISGTLVMSTRLIQVQLELAGDAQRWA